MAIPTWEARQVTDNPFHPNELTGLYNRILKIKSFDLETSPPESWGQVDISAKAKRRRILEEAKSAVLDRIRHAR